MNQDVLVLSCVGCICVRACLTPHSHPLSSTLAATHLPSANAHLEHAATHHTQQSTGSGPAPSEARRSKQQEARSAHPDRRGPQPPLPPTADSAPGTRWRPTQRTRPPWLPCPGPAGPRTWRRSQGHRPRAPPWRRSPAGCVHVGVKWWVPATCQGQAGRGGRPRRSCSPLAPSSTSPTCLPSKPDWTHTLPMNPPWQRHNTSYSLEIALRCASPTCLPSKPPAEMMSAMAPPVAASSSFRRSLLMEVTSSVRVHRFKHGRLCHGVPRVASQQLPSHPHAVKCWAPAHLGCSAHPGPQHPIARFQSNQPG